MQSFGKRLETAREALGLDRYDFAALVGVNGFKCREADIWRWENDRNMPRNEACVALAKAGNTTVEYLVTGELHAGIV